uniref:Uncharacterized protein n=1 Tax=Aquila chrysaetos chrysaetos TaxID=223781 RepID=A0A663FDR4_AQUCH
LACRGSFPLFFSPLHPLMSHTSCNSSSIACGDSFSIACGDSSNIACGDSSNIACGHSSSIACGDSSNIACGRSKAGSLGHAVRVCFSQVMEKNATYRLQWVFLMLSN